VTRKVVDYRVDVSLRKLHKAFLPGQYFAALAWGHAFLMRQQSYKKGCEYSQFVNTWIGSAHSILASRAAAQEYLGEQCF